MGRGRRGRMGRGGVVKPQVNSKHFAIFLYLYVLNIFYVAFKPYIYNSLVMTIH